jgi:hypothetical protein
MSRDSSVGIALDYELDDRGSRVRFPAGVGNFSIHHRIQNGSGAHPPSYAMGIRGSFPGVKRPGREADHSTPSSAEVKECVELYLHSQYAFMTWGSVKRKAQVQVYLYYHLQHLNHSRDLCNCITKRSDSFTISLFTESHYINS